jgi:hypothetical protein
MRTDIAGDHETDKLSELCAQTDHQPSIGDWQGFAHVFEKAIAAGLPWLACPACQQVGAIDLRTLDRHPGASISSLISSVSCRRWVLTCRGAII